MDSFNIISPLTFREGKTSYNSIASDQSILLRGGRSLDDTSPLRPFFRKHDTVFNFYHILKPSLFIPAISYNSIFSVVCNFDHQIFNVETKTKTQISGRFMGSKYEANFCIANKDCIKNYARNATCLLNVYQSTCWATLK